jgi:hypothetical protein
LTRYEAIAENPFEETLVILRALDSVGSSCAVRPATTSGQG